MSADLRGYARALRSELAEDVPPAARHLAWVLLSYADEAGLAWPSIATLCKGTGYKRAYALELLALLQAAGWIERRSGGSQGRSNTYRLSVPQVTLDPSAPVDPPVHPSGPHPSTLADTPRPLQWTPPSTPVDPYLPGNYQGTTSVPGGGQGAAAPSSLSDKSKPKTSRQGEARGDSGSPSKVKKSEVEVGLRQDALRRLEALEALDPDGTGELHAAAPLPSTRPRRSPTDEAARRAKLAEQIARLQQEANP